MIFREEEEETARTGPNRPRTSQSRSSRLLLLLPGPPPHLGQAADGAACLQRHLQAQTMGSVFGPLELTGAPEPPIVHRAAHAIHMQMRCGQGRRRTEGGVRGGGRGRARVRHPADDGTFFAPPHANLLSLKLLFGFTDSCSTARPSPLPHHLNLSRHTPCLSKTLNTKTHTALHTKFWKRK